MRVVLDADERSVLLSVNVKYPLFDGFIGWLFPVSGIARTYLVCTLARVLGVGNERLASAGSLAELSLVRGAALGIGWSQADDATKHTATAAAMNVRALPMRASPRNG